MKMAKIFQFIISATLFVVLISVKESHGHGMMLDPPGRSSRWRFDSSAPQNYDDNALYCGGFANQWNNHGGKCGLCGDDYALRTPRPNELGGLYGSGVITKTYTSSQTTNVRFQITANHLGYIYFNLCNLDEFRTESEDCFNKYRLRMADGSDKFYVGDKIATFDVTVVIPNVSCQHCVLRWTYNAGNNWGICENGTGATGCGPQETFKSCADIKITARRSGVLDVQINDELPPEILDDRV